MAGVRGFEPRRCQSQSLVPYRLAIPQLCNIVVEEDGFEPPNPMGNDLQSSAFGRFATPPKIMVDAEGLEPPTPAL